MTGKSPPQEKSQNRLRLWLRAVRVHQWMKNLLVFAPVVTAHQVLNFDKLLAGLLAFASLCLVASATYLVNDLLDINSDRAHASKRHRPIACGAIKASSALVAAGLLFASGLLLATQLPKLFLASIVAYSVATLLYSFWLKRVASLDVVMLAGLYTLRVIAGGLATGIQLSFWLLAFSIFLFLALALAKRVAELVDLAARARTAQAAGSALVGRQYGTEDIQVLQVMGIVSGYLAVLVLALYINSPEVVALYRTPQVLWLVAPAMLLWMTRLWIVTSRGYMHEDPVLFAIKDPETWAVAAFTGVVLMAATRLNL